VSLANFDIYYLPNSVSMNESRKVGKRNLTENYSYKIENRECKAMRIVLFK